MTSRKRLRVAIDAMGGDHAPDSVIDGLALMAEQDPGIDFLVYGDESRVRPLIEKHKNLGKRVELQHTDVVVFPNDPPKAGMRSKRAGSSMRLAVESVKSGEADFCVSGGNTGALMTVATLILRKIPGVNRSAMVAAFPTDLKPLVFLDCGANLDCTAETLKQFAIMGAIYSKTVFDVNEPKIGLLNIGTEEGKGLPEIQQTRDLLSVADLPGKFVGFVEPNSISYGCIDVVVADGVTGNIALKMAEGIAAFIVRRIRKEIYSGPISFLGGMLSMAAFRRARERIDPNRFNGGMFIGLNGICMKSHGGANSVAFKNAIVSGAKLVRQNAMKEIEDAFAEFVSGE